MQNSELPKSREKALTSRAFESRNRLHIDTLTEVLLIFVTLFIFDHNNLKHPGIFFKELYSVM